MPFPRRSSLLAAVVTALAFVSACTPPGRATAPVTRPANRPPSAAEQAAAMSDVDLVGQVLMPSINMDDPVDGSVQLLRRYHLGGLILMGNVENRAAGGSAAQVRQLTDALRSAAHAAGQPLEPLMATDQEYGWVTQIKSGIVQLPSGMTFGAAGQPAMTRDAWLGAGTELAQAGINVDFAPDADVVASAANTTIGSRSFGDDAQAVGEQVAAVVSGLQSVGVAAAIKHFPGHGHTSVNSHDALPVLRQSRAAVEADDLPPFRAGINAGAWLVMSGHLDFEALDPGVPASFSSKILTDLLRGELGFQGVVITDALNMKPAMAWAPEEAAVRAFLAGNDILLMPPDLAAARKGMLDALASGRIPRHRMIESVSRILTLKQRLAGFPRPALGTTNTAENRAAALAVAQMAVTVLRGPCAGPLVDGPVRVTASNGRDQQVAWLTDALKARGVPVVTRGGHRVHLVGYLDGPADLAPDAAVTVAMDTPFLLASATSPVRVATYSSTQVAMLALAATIAGTIPATGRSPVPVDGLPRSACETP